MTVLLGAIIVLVMLFGLVAFIGAPYVPTLRPQVSTALDLLDLKPGEILLEVGFGDGKVMLSAAERGWNVVGYEINPVLCLIALWRTRKMRKNVKIIWGNMWTKQWPEVQGIYVFGVSRIMQKLNTKIVQTQSKPVKLVSFGFQVPDRKAIREKNGLFLYEYAAK